jgi:hypothetical protein
MRPVLLEICALTQTLLLDEDGLCDPAQFNDRLLLGLKGTTERGGAPPVPRPLARRTFAEGAARRVGRLTPIRTGVWSQWEGGIRSEPAGSGKLLSPVQDLSAKPDRHLRW